MINVFPDYYCLQRSCEGYVFTRVCDSVHGGVCYPSMHCRWYPSMPCSRGDVCYPSMHCRWYPSMPCSRGGLLREGVCSRGVCSQGGCLLRGGACSGGRSAPGGGWRPLPKADGYCCGRYASYWNAFLFILDLHFFFLRNTWIWVAM